MNDPIIYDFAAVGIGPFNLSLAAMAHSVPEIKSIFFDQAEGFDWHPGMMLQDATLQTPFMCDLVTMADPTHPMTFLNYKKRQGRLYSFYIRESFYLLRQEYNRYCQWACEQMDNLRWNHRVERTCYLDDEQCYELYVKDMNSGRVKTIKAKNLVLGTGTKPYFPECAKPLSKEAHLLHSSDYLTRKDQLQQLSSITVVGSGQSAAEVYYDLLQDIDSFDYELNWVTRSPRFFPLELSKLTLEMTSPDYVDYFFALPDEKRQALIKNQKNLYKGINSELIDDIFNLLYTKYEKLDQQARPLKVNLTTNTSLNGVKKTLHNFELDLKNIESEQEFIVSTQGLVLSTGYHYQRPEFLDGINQEIRYRADGMYDVDREYNIAKKDNIFVQNAELHTHGFVSPDLGMVCYRNAHIMNAIMGQEIYPIEEQIAFQSFGSVEQNSEGQTPGQFRKAALGE